MKKLSFLLIITALLTACGQNNGNEKSKKQPVTIKEVLSYEITDVLKQDTTCTKDIMHCTHVRLEYPDFTGNNAATPNRLTHNLITYLLYDDDIGSNRSNDLNKVAEDFLLNFYNFKRSFPNTKTFWIFRLKSTPIYEHDSLLCFSFASEQNMGRAHGTIEKYFITFNRFTGNKFWPLSLISDIDRFTATAEKIFRERKNIKPDEDLNKAGYTFKNGKFKLPSNIGLGEKGFVLRYNVYEIAPYAMGTTEFSVSYKVAGVKK